MAKIPDLSLVLPCYREAAIFDESVARIVDVLKLSLLTFEIIFVDDKSPDNTVQYIKKACKKYSHCHAIYHHINTGRGRAVTDGILAAKGTCVGYIDIDLEVSPVYIPHLVSLILSGRTDVAIGKRIYRTSLSAIPREILSSGYQWLSNVMIGTGGMDTETGYKFFNRKKILPILTKTKHPHWFWDTEIMLYAKRAGLRISEVPVLFLRRTDKESTVRVFRDIKDYLMSLWKLRQRLNQGLMKEFC